MTPAVRAEAAARRALAEAAELRLLGLLLERPRKGWHEEGHALAEELRDASLKSLQWKAGSATEGEYLALLGPGGLVSPREVAYLPMEDPGRILADLQGFYKAFHFEPNIEEPIDHIATEVAFLGYMKMKQAYALACGDPEAESLTAAAIERFLEVHLSGLCAVFAGRLASTADSYLTAAAAALAARLGVPIADPGAPFAA